MPGRGFAALAIAVLAACAGLLAFGERAQAQTVVPIPKLSAPADVPNGFQIEVVDENNPENAATYDTIGRLEVRASAGTQLLGNYNRNRLRDGRLCRNTGNICAFWPSLHRITNSGNLAVTAAVEPEIIRFVPPAGQTRITVEARLWPPSDPNGNGSYKSATLEVEFRSTLQPEPRILRYDFVRVNGAEHYHQRDRIGFRLGWNSEHWDHRFITGFRVAGPPGSFITRHEQQRNGVCTLTRALTDDAPGHICTFTDGSEAREFSYSSNLLGNVLYFAPPRSGSGTARITITADLLTGGTASGTLDIRYGPTLPADLGHPYPVFEFREHPLRRRTAPFTNDGMTNGDQIWSAVIIRDERDDSHPRVRPQEVWEWAVMDWVDPDADDPLQSGIGTYSVRGVPGRAADRRVVGGGGFGPLNVAGWIDRAGSAETVRWEQPFYFPATAPAAGSGRLLGEFSVDAARDDLGVTPLRTVTLYGSFRYGIPLPPAEGSAGDPVMAMDLPHDADQIVGPGETAAVRASLSATITEPEDRDVVVACIHTYEAAPPPPSTYRTNPSPYCAYNDLLDAAESYLVITGPATWRDTGGKRLEIGAGSGYPVLQCRDLDEDLTVVCDAKSLVGEYPELVVDDDAAGDEIAISAKFASRELAGRGGFHIVWGEVGADWGSHAPLAERPDEIFGRFSFALLGIQQVHTAVLERDGDGPVLAGAEEALRLRIRNERGDAADAAAIDSIIIIAAGGGQLDSDWCNASVACAFDIAALRESAKAGNRGPELIGEIPLSLRLPETLGNIELTATITAAGRTLRAELALEVLGTAAGLELGGSLALGSGLPIVHHHATPDDDDRDIAIISARASDALDRATALPIRAVREVFDPAGNIVVDGVIVTEQCLHGRLSCSYRVQVTAPREDPLELGRYALRVTADDRVASAGFIVVGPAAGIEVIGAEPKGIWQTFDFRVRVTDDQGNPVADGTAVWWDATTRSPAGGPTTAALVAITPLIESYTKTKGGEAVAEVMTVGEEIGVLYAHAGGLREDPDVSTLVVVDTGLPDDCTARQLSEVAADAAAGMAFATFNGGHFCRASDLFASLSPDWSALHLWNGKKWVPYAEADDGPAPGTSDYLIAPGDMLCLIAAQTAAVSDQEPANPG